LLAKYSDNNSYKFNNGREDELKRKVHRTFRFLILLAILLFPWTDGWYELTDLEYWKPDSPAWKKLESFKPHIQGPIALGVTSGLLTKNVQRNAMKYMLLPLYCYSAGGQSRKINRWEKSLIDNPFYRGPKDMVRYKEDYIRELTRIKNTFKETFGSNVHFFTVNKTLLITEFILIFILYGVSLLFCLFIDRG
jgi:hypothetical protein